MTGAMIALASGLGFGFAVGYTCAVYDRRQLRALRALCRRASGPRSARTSEPLQVDPPLRSESSCAHSGGSESMPEPSDATASPQRSDLAQWHAHIVPSDAGGLLRVQLTHASGAEHWCYLDPWSGQLIGVPDEVPHQLRAELLGALHGPELRGTAEGDA